MSGGPFLYPNVTTVPGSAGVERPDRLGQRDRSAQPGEFAKTLDQTIEQAELPLKISAHASQRLQDRNIRFDREVMAKVSDAVEKAAAKGVEDTLVLAGDAAFIVSVKNRTMITALDRSQLSGNVFTNIDGAVIV